MINKIFRTNDSSVSWLNISLKIAKNSCCYGHMFNKFADNIEL